MRITNTSDTQLPVIIEGPHKDTDTMLLQPKGSVELPEGFQPADTMQRYLYVHKDEQATPAKVNGKEGE